MKYELFLLDMDGTLYIDQLLFEGVKEMLAEIKERQGQITYITNNSSRSVSHYIEHLKAFGIEASPDDFYTSSMATIHYLKKNYQDPLCFVVGTSSLMEEFQQQHLRVTNQVEDPIDVVILGYDRELTYQKLIDISYILSTKHVDYIATNPDMTCPASFGYVPDCGSFAEMIYHATGKNPVFIGKPNKEMIELACQNKNIDLSKAVVIGDRLHTDILSGNRAGVDTVFVLSGESTMEDLSLSQAKPTYIYPLITDFYTDLKKEKL